jgi:hypothetical protein
MRRTLYGVLENTSRAAAELRSRKLVIDPDIDRRLARFEEAIERALASSPDRTTVAQPEEFVALDALCELHIAVQGQPESLRSLVRPIVDEWIAYAVTTGLTPQELAARTRTHDVAAPLETWLDHGD